MLFDLTGKVAVVTGSTKGIGRGIAEQLVAHGARVVVTGRNQQASDAAATAIDAAAGGRGGVARGVAFDLEAVEAVPRFAADALAAFGRVDILVCNAAALPFTSTASVDTPPEEFERILLANVHGNFRLCHALRPAIAAQGGGAVILIGSIAAHNARFQRIAYAVSKAGLAHMGRCLAAEFAPDRITVNIIAPGLIRSATSERVLADEALARRMVAGVPMGRIGEPEDIAGLVIYFASRSGSYVTGETVIVDGGRTILSSAMASV